MRGDRGPARRVRRKRQGCLHVIEDLWFRLKAWFHRRRNSYKLALFFLLQGLVCLVSFIFAIAMYYLSWAGLNSFNENCVSGVPPFDSDIRTLTLETRRALVCDGDGRQNPACTLGDIRLLLNGILISGVTMFLQCALSFQIAYAYNMFSNLPQGLLQHGKSNRAVSFFGALCKKGPWFCKFLHVFQGLTLMTLIIFMSLGFCSMDMSMTSKCVNYEADCAYNKMKNCRYFYKYCLEGEADEDSMRECYDPEFRSKFSGHVDIRLLHDTQCVRCRILTQDKDRASVEEFWLLNDSDRSNADIWKCAETLPQCFGATTESVQDIFCTGCGLSADSREGCSRRLGDRQSHIGRGQQRRLTGETKKLEQGCSQGPGSEEEFFFDSQDCSRASSTWLFRQFVLYLYLVAVGWLNLTFIGQLLRVTLRVEPWFLNPRTPRENIFWRIIRMAGPPMM